MKRKNIVAILLSFFLIVPILIPLILVEAKGVYTGEHWDTSEQCDYPQGITNNGTHFWIISYFNKRVYRYTIDGTYLDSWDVSGQCNYPNGIATDGSNIWVIDKDADEVYKYSMTGAYIDSWDTAASGCEYAKEITTDGSNIWIIDLKEIVPNHSKVYKYTMQGVFVNSWDVSSQSTNSYGITTNGTSIWISDIIEDRVYKFNMTGGYIESWSISAQSDNSRTITNNGTHFWILDYMDDEVYQYVYIPNIAPNTPTLNSPANNTKVEPSTNVNVSWTFSDPDGGDTQSSYRFQLSSSPDFSTTLNDSNKATSSNEYYLLDFPEQLAVYYVRVKTWDNSDAEGSWSSTLFIEVAAAQEGSGWIPSPSEPLDSKDDTLIISPEDKKNMNLGIYVIIGVVGMAIFWGEAGKKKKPKENTFKRNGKKKNGNKEKVFKKERKKKDGPKGFKRR